jgi:hypothetical protein
MGLKLDTDIDVDGCLDLLNSLSNRQTKTAIRKGVRKASKPLQTHYKSLLKQSFKTTKELGGVYIYNDKSNPLGVVASIKHKQKKADKKFLLTVYELGTYKKGGRWQEKKSKANGTKLKKKRYTGKIEPKGLFAQSIDATENVIMTNMQVYVAGCIKQAYNKNK